LDSGVAGDLRRLNLEEVITSSSLTALPHFCLQRLFILFILFINFILFLSFFFYKKSFTPYLPTLPRYARTYLTTYLPTRALLLHTIQPFAYWARIWNSPSSSSLLLILSILLLPTSCLPLGGLRRHSYNRGATDSDPPPSWLRRARPLPSLPSSQLALSVSQCCFVHWLSSSSCSALLRHSHLAHKTWEPCLQHVLICRPFTISSRYILPSSHPSASLLCCPVPVF
jgi:hypothetical protein